MLVTDTYIKVDSKTILVKDITSSEIVEHKVQRRETEKEYKARTKNNSRTLVILLSLIFLAPFVMNMFDVSRLVFELWQVSLLITAPWLIISLLRLNYRLVPDCQYSVAIVITSGNTQLFTTSNYEFAKNINEIITNVITNQLGSVAYNINVEKQEINNNIGELYDINIENHSGLSSEDMKFLNGVFRESIEELGKQIKSTNDNDEIKEIFNGLVEQLNSSNPKPGVIRKLYSGLKEACDGYEVATAVAGISGLVTQAVNIFST